jgi:predicted transcriptional regulator
MDIKQEILKAVKIFEQEELSLSSVEILLTRLKEVVNTIPDDAGCIKQGYEQLLSTVDTLETENRGLYTQLEMSDRLNMVIQSFVKPVCRHCNGTGRIQVPIPTGFNDYTEDICFCVKEVK